MSSLPCLALADGGSAPMEPSRPEARTLARELARHCSAYRDPNALRAAYQLVTTAVPFGALCAFMLWSVGQGWWPALVLAPPAAGLLVRLFIIQHDCGHGSFFGSRFANHLVGRVLSVVTMTPYGFWRRAHALHHATAGNLSRRGIGDVDTLTVREYLALSRWKRLRYRLYRNPFILLVLGPPVHFLLLQRSPFGLALPLRETWRSVLGLDLAIVIFYGGLMAGLGIGPVLWVGLPIVFGASWVGGWLFFVQHQFEDTQWDDGAQWDFHEAAIAGSSYYVLPKVLQWFTGNVGLHHIHHLNSRVPNYRLQECLDGHAVLGSISRLTLAESLGCVRLSLWDEERRKLVGFSHLKAMAA